MKGSARAAALAGGGVRASAVVVIARLRMTAGGRRFDRGKYQRPERGRVSASAGSGEAPAGLRRQLLQLGGVLGRDFVLGERALAERDPGELAKQGNELGAGLLGQAVVAQDRGGHGESGGGGASRGSVWRTQRCAEGGR